MIRLLGRGQYDPVAPHREIVAGSGAACAFPCRSPRGPLQSGQRKPGSAGLLCVRLAVWKASFPLTEGFRRFAPASPPACGGAMHKAIKKSSSSKLGWIFCYLSAVRGGFEPPVR